MKKMHFLTRKAGLFCMLMFALAALSGCDSKSELTYSGHQKTFEINLTSNPALTGKITLKEMSDLSTEITVEIPNQTANTNRPAHIHSSRDGSIVVTLNHVTEGRSVTRVTKTDGGRLITYTELLNYDGYVNVHESDARMNLIVAQGDLGTPNPGSTMSLLLSPVGNSLSGGSADIKRTKSGAIMVTLSLIGGGSGTVHPAHIHRADDGSIAVNLQPIDATSGKSITLVKNMVDGTPITFDQLIKFPGYINTHKSEKDLTVIAKANIR